MKIFEHVSWWSENDSSASLVFQCTSCNTCFEVQRQVCPECGGYDIDRRTWTDVSE
ncbi:DUF1272 domain-containing protein [Halorussus gelatinilyticus]|uniref:DUF1272 domain-containing protein n=1 Tax=Halorussus gelatinilyticus TaxID=2937524 RepID=A0A8U0IFX4_9EURY|nr:DUF1272 domain-containing protein [Halorussus gelatinilyticus]UPV98958.1 DUF1272 domain-containing protein [Halorussus gelatinilyticus]